MTPTLLEIPFDIVEENHLKKPHSKSVPKAINRKKLINKLSQTDIVDKKTHMPVDRQEAMQCSTEYFNGDELAAKVWLDKYALKDVCGKIYEKSPKDMHLRLSAEIARIEKKYPNPLSKEQVFNLLDKFKYLIPQGGPMTGIGNDFQYASLSNCFVVGYEGDADSYGAVMKIDEEQVQLMKRRGGVGHDLSGVRPTGAQVQNSALSATGILPFMERYSNSTREVAQGGRRGALMLSLSVKHPDIEKFIDAKKDSTKITGANVSVKITDNFMNAVKGGEEFQVQFPVDSAYPSVKNKVDAKKLWNKIVHNAWKSAEPGLLFWDTIINESVADSYADQGFKTVSTNPCGEIPLCPYDSCRLLAINLFSYVESPFTNKATFDFNKFKKHAGYAQRIMDDIVDLEIEKIDRILDKIDKDPEAYEIKRTEYKLWNKIRQKCVEGRRQGIGITAEGDMIAAMGLRYGSSKAIDHAVEVHKSLAIAVYKGSVELAKERGAFPIYNRKKEQNSVFLNRIFKESPSLMNDMKKHGRRNISMLTIAPTGTTSMMTQTTSGIEPVFNVNYKRRVKINPEDKSATPSFVDKSGDSWKEYNVFHHHFETWLKSSQYKLENVKTMTDEELQKVIAHSPYYKATANDVDWISKVQMQGAIQKWVDHSISVTVNLPEDTKEELIGDIYIKAWESGCKGVTVYRNGSRDGVLINDSKEKKKEPFVVKRPKYLEVDIMRFNNNHEKWIAVIGKMEGRPYEIFTGKAEGAFMLPSYVEKGKVRKHNVEGKNQYDLQYLDKDGYEITLGGLSRAFDKEYWNYAKMISAMLRHEVSIDKVVHLINNLHLNDESLNTWKNGVVRVLSKYIPNGTMPRNNTCPDCNQESLVYEEGCLNCKNCGHSKCG
ncbi:MAG: adenosylcobalamin-dependent ribonucleoside-diphosphate reductase [Cyclobacteriaceae bacterium]|nr:adenosylcobalamin-dependent ribonucleoside-diphosphate reductase [Cyclobacteriaceae bacterium]